MASFLCISRVQRKLFEHEASVLKQTETGKIIKFVCHIVLYIVPRFFFLNHSYLETPRRVIGKQCRPRSDNVASNQSLDCLLTGFSTKNRIKETKEIRHP